MRYFFECGNFKNLSQAELSAQFISFGISPDCIKSFNDNVLLVESNTLKIDTLSKIFNRLGGYIRYGEVIEDLDLFLKPFTKTERLYSVYH